MTPLISVIVPVRAGESTEMTMQSLSKQTCQEFNVHVVTDTMLRGAPWARNEGMRYSLGSHFVLFSDADIVWAPTALEDMVCALKDKQEQGIGYAYGGYYLLSDGEQAIGPIGH